MGNFLLKTPQSASCFSRALSDSSIPSMAAVVAVPPSPPPTPDPRNRQLLLAIQSGGKEGGAFQIADIMKHHQNITRF